MATPLQEQLQALYALQQIDTQLQRAKRAQSALDQGVDATQAAAAAHSEEQARLEHLHHCQAELKDSELKLSTIETKRKSYQDKFYQGTVTNPRELSNIEKEIDALGRQRSDLDGRILEIMEKVELAETDLKLASEKAKEADAHRDEVIAAFKSRHQTLEREIADAMRRRPEAAALVTDKALLKQYEDIRVRAKGVGIGKIEGGDCGGCHMTLPGGVVKLTREGQQAQICENCGRLLTI